MKDLNFSGHDLCLEDMIAWKSFNKLCRTCDTARRLRRVPKEHKCHKNYTGTSKGMEPKAAVDLFQENFTGSIKVNAMARDDDATTIAHLHREVDHTIKKISDLNHNRKGLRGRLERINSKELTGLAKESLIRNYNYAIRHNKDNPEGLAETLMAIPGHMYGEHYSCDISWCGFIQKNGPNMPGVSPYKHYMMKKDLTCPELRQDLENLMKYYANNAENIISNIYKFFLEI